MSRLDIMEIINWCNENQGFVSALAAGTSLFIGLIAIVFSAVALWQTHKQSKQNFHQQKQNEGLRLYPLRREVMELFLKKEFDDIYWDAAILFSDEIFDGIEGVARLSNAHKSSIDKIEIYKSRFKNDEPDLYEKFIILEDSDNNTDNFYAEALYELSDKYNPIVQMPGEESEIVLNYRSLVEDELSKRRMYEVKYLKVFLNIKSEIRQSLKG